jgi:hypothetical protein
MSEKINLKELQRKAWRSIFQDGLWDIFMGLLLLNIAVFTVADELFANDDLKLALFIGGEIAAFLFLWAGKRFITVPRMGKAKFGRFGKVRRSKAKLLSFASILVGLIVFLIIEGLSENGQIAGLSRVYIVAVGWVINAMLVFGLAGYFLDFNRLYLIGAMYALSFPLDLVLRELWNTDRWAFFAYAIPASIVLAVGLYFFVNFVQKFPIVQEGA